ncbi:MAG: hypothetical protein L3J52_01165 [Proteobacteria bacterium]|nr:hypothetical protein [Pseudomonadota bacterium]
MNKIKTLTELIKARRLKLKKDRETLYINNLTTLAETDQQKIEAIKQLDQIATRKIKQP